jgi:hypothetical protein
LRVCRGSSLWFSSFGLVVCALCLSMFCLGCVESFPLPKGSETCIFQVIFLFAFLWLSIACWSFFCSFLFFLFSLGLLYVCVVNGLIKGEIEDHVWFEDRWMVTSWCDEWLTTLCEPILG